MSRAPHPIECEGHAEAPVLNKAPTIQFGYDEGMSGGDKHTAFLGIRRANGEYFAIAYFEGDEAREFEELWVSAHASMRAVEASPMAGDALREAELLVGGLELLRMAIEANDKRAQLILRVNDLLKDAIKLGKALAAHPTKAPELFPGTREASDGLSVAKAGSREGNNGR